MDMASGLLFQEMASAHLLDDALGLRSIAVQNGDAHQWLQYKGKL